jgi:hypothetical protein
LGEWIKGAGASKAIAELSKLKGKNYISAYQSVLEFYMPKQQRVIKDDNQKPTTTINNILNVLSFDNKAIVLEALRRNNKLQMPTTQPQSINNPE